MSRHYANADVGRLLKLAIRLLKRNEIRTVSELPMADAVDKLETWFCEVVDLWRGWQDSNPRPLGS